MDPVSNYFWVNLINVTTVSNNQIWSERSYAIFHVQYNGLNRILSLSMLVE